MTWSGPNSMRSPVVTGASDAQGSFRQHACIAGVGVTGDADPHALHVVTRLSAEGEHELRVTPRHESLSDRFVRDLEGPRRHRVLSDAVLQLPSLVV